MNKHFKRLKQVLQRFFCQWILPDIAVLFFCLLLLGITWGATYWQMEEDRESTIANVIQVNDKFSLAFEEHVRRIIKTNHQYLDMLQREYEATQEISLPIQRLLTQMARDPVIVQATVANSRGEVIASILPYSPGVNVAHMPHFRIHVANDIRQAYIGKPVRDSVSDQRFIHMSHRLNNRDGSFAGVATVAIDPGYFTKFYQDMDFNEKYVVRLVSLDGIVYASNTDDEIGADIFRTQLFSELANNSDGFYRSEGELINKTTLMNYRQMYDYPFVNQFGVVEEALLPLYQRRSNYIGVTVGISLFILLYAVKLIRSARRLRLSEANVQASYGELSATHEELIAIEEEIRLQYDELIAANQKLAAQEMELKERDERLQLSCNNLSAAHEELTASEEELRVQYNLLLRMNEQVERQNSILSLLQETAFSLLNKLDMEQLLQTIVSRAAAMVGATDAFIVLPADDELTLEVKAGIGIYGGEVLSLPVRWGLMGKVYADGKAQVVDNYFEWEGRASIPFAARVCSIFAAPLRAKRKVAGVFGVAFCEPERKFNEDQVLLLERFAELASLALENAALHSHLQDELEKRSKSETTLSEILNATNDAIIINEPTTGGILWTNPRAAAMFGYSEEELKQLGAVAISTAPNLEAAKSAMRKAISEGPQFYERDTKDKFGCRIVVEISVKRAVIDGKVLCLTMMRDITQRKQMEGEIEQIQAEQQAVFDAIPDELLLFDQAGRFLACHKPHDDSARFIRPEVDPIGRNVVKALPTEIGHSFLAYIQQANETGVTQFHEYIIPSGGTVGHWDVRFLKVGSNKVLAMLRDMTAIRRSEERVQYLSLYDSLTEVYNRTYFEAEMMKMVWRENGGVAILVCDVDGLKLINDTLGHRAGDDVLRVVASTLRSALIAGEDIVARIGGDEFAVILYAPRKGQIEEKVDQIRQRIASYNQDNPHLPVSLSVGWAADYESCKAPVELFKQADHDMYRQKLHQGQSIRSAIVQTMMKALEARDYITEGHAERLQDLAEGLGRKVQLSSSQSADLRLFAKFHDIGKVGIPDRVLNKPSKLDEEEVIVMRRHCEIGFRIAQASPDLTPIADCILKHQEWWNGQGYPLGISGAEIPLACRILALADAYDAMTNDRPYRKALSHNEALAEIERCAGSQFDPSLALLFVEMLRSE